jgi:hypothetical protein
MVPEFFNWFMPTDYLWLTQTPITSGVHCLGILQESMLNKNEIDIVKDGKGPMISHVLARKQEMIHCVSALREAAVDFKRMEKCLFWDLKFRRGVVEIPAMFNTLQHSMYFSQSHCI